MTDTSPLNNTIVSACDNGYAIGVWLLIASIRKSGMRHPILIGAYNWTDEWKSDILKFPDVTIADLPVTDKRSVTCSKPEIMLQAQTDVVTWIDCDGIVSGDMTDALQCPDGMINIRPKTVSEIQELYRKSRLPSENPDMISSKVLNIWQNDVGGLESPRYNHGFGACLIGLSLPRNRGFLEKWREQMLKVLPEDVSLVHDGSVAYFQTDESVLNSLMLFQPDAPELKPHYTADLLDRPHYIHFGYNPKPWIMWNSYSLKHFDKVADIAEWAVKQGYAPHCPLPYTFKRSNKRLCSLLAPFSKPIAKFRKYKRKWFK
ncbi:MAG: hypothetical protein K5787_00940 [Lentisphaeria bacterium]|nr:hypothetical protein [Lentisphaeria bacterium]